MATVGDFTSFILGAFKSEEDGRVALYHYLKNFHIPETQVKPELINDFFSEALRLPYWQERKPSLFADIQEVLQRFFSQVNQPFRLDLLWDISKLQLVSISSSETLCTIVKEFETAFTLEGETLRVVPEGETRVMAIRRTTLGEVIIRTYDNLVRVNGARLSPLCPDQELFYDPGMELKRNLFHKLKTGPHSQVRFLVESAPATSIIVQFINGFAFRQAQTLSLGGLHQEPKIFFPLKRLERYYIYRPSDPYYMELISSMEQALVLLQSRKEGAYEFARQAFDSGQIAFDQIFPDDKALYSRLRELAKWISNPNVRQAYIPQDMSPQA